MAHRSKVIIIFAAEETYYAPNIVQYLSKMVVERALTVAGVDNSALQLHAWNSMKLTTCTETDAPAGANLLHVG